MNARCSHPSPKITPTNLVDGVFAIDTAFERAVMPKEKIEKESKEIPPRGLQEGMVGALKKNEYRGGTPKTTVT